VIIAPAAHSHIGEIPEDGTKGPQLLNVEHHLIAYQRDDKEVHDECLLVDEELDIVADAGTGHLIAIGDRHLEARVKDRLEVETTCCFCGDE
jgi:hypothetical protein